MTNKERAQMLLNYAETSIAGLRLDVRHAPDDENMYDALHQLALITEALHDMQNMFSVDRSVRRAKIVNSL